MNRDSLLSLFGAAAFCAISLSAHGGSVHGQDGSAAGAVYTMTNAVAGNEIVVFERDGKGGLALASTVSTGGAGSGGGLDPLVSQSSLKLTQDGNWLLAVNAGSNEISVFRVGTNGLELTDRTASGGTFPTSLAVYHDVVYVLNERGAPNITGFILNHWGRLVPIPSSTRTLPGSAHAQIGFDPKGEVIVVTDRSTNSLLVYPIAEDGTATADPIVSPSHGSGPFSFAFTSPRTVLVAEVGSNAVTSYELLDDGTLATVTGSVANGQAATCWIVDAGGRFAYTANPGASSVSAYREQPGSGAVSLVAGAAGIGARPLDLAVSVNGQYLYALDPGVGGIDAFRIQADGTLVGLGPLAAGLPLYAQGLAAR